MKYLGINSLKEFGIGFFSEEGNYNGFNFPCESVVTFERSFATLGRVFLRVNLISIGRQKTEIAKEIARYINKDAIKCDEQLLKSTLDDQILTIGMQIFWHKDHWDNVPTDYSKYINELQAEEKSGKGISDLVIDYDYETKEKMHYINLKEQELEINGVMFRVPAFTEVFPSCIAPICDVNINGLWFKKGSEIKINKDNSIEGILGKEYSGKGIILDKNMSVKLINNEIIQYCVYKNGIKELQEIKKDYT